MVLFLFKLQQMLGNPNALAEKDEADEVVQKLKNVELLSEKLISDISKKEDEIEISKMKILEKEKNCDNLSMYSNMLLERNEINSLNLLI